MDPSKDKFYFPSGAQLPSALRKKIEEKMAVELAAEQHGHANVETPGRELEFMTTLTGADHSSAQLIRLSEDLLDQSSSSDDLERKNWKASVALVDVQKQIYRGEEAYYDETFGHGSLFKSWEGYLDVKEASSSVLGPTGISSRRVPQGVLFHRVLRVFFLF